MQQSPYKTSRLAFWREQDLKKTFISTLDNIEESGWSALLIDADNIGSRFAYSVGIYDTQKFPEIIVIGLLSKTAHLAIEYSLEAMQRGVDLTIGRHREIVGEVEVIFRPVSNKWYEHVMCRADWYYTNDEVPVLQLIYPHTKGHFQWEEDFNEYFRQPLLQPNTEEGIAERDFWAANDPDSSLSRWKFSDPPHTSAYLSETVHRKEEAVTYVSHDDNGDWQFLGDKMSEGGGPVLSCLHHPIDNDLTLEQLHDLPLNWYATREHPGAPWQRYEHQPEEN
jgi:Domain of unknown function (DUF4262)